MSANIALANTAIYNNNIREIQQFSVKQKWEKWGTKSYSVMPHVSPPSKKIAENYQLRPSDVVVLSFPKTGTTWTQTVCEQIRTNAEGYEGFDDITERQPWLEFAYDCGQNLDEEICGMLPKNQPIADDASKDLETNLRGPILTPRIFKSHQLPSAVNPGGKYLCIVRDPASTLLSWFDFQKAKGRPGYAEYADANEYIANRPELFSGNYIFGTNLWEMYAELWSARNDPSVKILVYEGLVADASQGYLNHFPIIEEFLGKTSSPHKHENETSENEISENELYKRVAVLVSREEMMKHVNRFDDHFISEMGKKYGRALRVMEPAPKVRSKGNRTELTEATLEWLEDQWMEKMTPKTGHTTYDEFATQLSELLFEDEEVEERNSAMLQETSVPRHSRRKSSLVIDQMPRIRQRRESIAPHE